MMRNPHLQIRSGLVALVTLCAFGTVLPAQTAGNAPPKPLKIAVIDVQKILTDSKPGKAVLEELKKLQTQKADEDKAKQQEISDLRQRISDGRLSLSQDKLAELQKSLEDKVIAYRRFQDDADREMDAAKSRAFGKVEDQVMPIIQKVGEERGYTLIFRKFESGLVFAQDDIDITKEIVDRLDQSPQGAAKPQ